MLSVGCDYVYVVWPIVDHRTLFFSFSTLCEPGRLRGWSGQAALPRLAAPAAAETLRFSYSRLMPLLHQPSSSSRPSEGAHFREVSLTLPSARLSARGIALAPWAAVHASAHSPPVTRPCLIYPGLATAYGRATRIVVPAVLGRESPLRCTC